VTVIGISITPFVRGTPLLLAGERFSVFLALS